MKQLLYSSFLILCAIFLFSCNGNREKTTERTLIDTDTVAVEKEYEVEKTIREKTVIIDTVTETETVEVETDLDSASQN